MQLSSTKSITARTNLGPSTLPDSVGGIWLWTDYLFAGLCVVGMIAALIRASTFTNKTFASKEEGKKASATHDRFNLVTIPPIVALTVWCLLAPTTFRNALLAWSLEAYIWVDVVYTLVVPQVHPNGTRWWSIMIHHFLTGFAMVHCINTPRNAHLLCWSTIVEINTLCQVIFKATKLKIFNLGFIATWFTMRLGWYPFIVWYYHGVVTGQGYSCFGHEYIQVVVGHFAITVLNYLWTIEFVGGMMKPRRKTKDGKSD